MRWFVLLLGLALVVSGLYLRRQETPVASLEGLAAAPGTLRRTGSGPVVGAVTARGVQVWLGIPYARAPVGDYRWRTPRPPQPWDTPREATAFGPPCPQFASRLGVPDAEPGTLVGAEDCLSLNIFAPTDVDERASLPVMVFIHGGGNTVGSAQPYDGSRLAQEQGVIVVTLNYRLGVLGWFSHRALRGSARNALDASGNFALLDIRRALHWLRDNISAFGGNPGRVTLFGESAGGRNIFGLLASKPMSGLFHGAIIQSGTAGSYTLARAENPVDAPQPGHENSSEELLMRWLQTTSAVGTRAAARDTLQRLADADLVAYMRAMPLEELMAPLQSEGGMYDAPALFRDGTVLPAKPLLEVFADADGWNRMPVIAGTNRDEMKLFLALSPTHTKQRLGLFPAPRDPARYNTLAALYSRQWKAVGVDAPLAQMQRADPTLPLFAYRFDWDAMRSNFLADLPQLLGAAHGLELDFIFGPMFSRAVPGVLHDGNRAGYEALARSMRDYWAGFAYSGRPGGGRSAAQPQWPPWSESEPLNMVFDAPADGGPRAETLSVPVAAVKVELLGAQGLSDRERCGLYVDLFLDNNGVSELFDAREYQELGCGQFPSWGLAGFLR